MEFIDAVQTMLPHLTGGLEMTVYEEDAQVLTLFERRFCLMPSVQTLYTKSGLLDFFSQKNEKHIYQITEPLGTRLAALRIGMSWILLGPFVTDAWDKSEAKAILARQGLREDALCAYQSYRCALPILPEEYAVRVAVLLLTNTVGNPPRELERIDMAVQKADQLPPAISSEYEDPAQVIHRYALENQFIEAVTKGQTSKAIKISTEFRMAVRSVRFMSNTMRDEIAGAMAMRTMVRRAALSVGLTPILVDALSQEYAQKMHSTTDERKLNELIDKYIAAFCQAIRLRCQSEHSLYINRALQYIVMHLSQPIDAETLADFCGITRRHLTALFRKEIGKTVTQYITEARCTRAAELLEDTQLLVQEVSHYVGYEDTNYFARVFRRNYGLSPQDYRKKRKY